MAEKAKKKGGKLPIILVAVLVVAGGGFFAMGGKKEEPKEEPKVKLGPVQSLGGEFLINLKDGHTFLVAEISVQIDEKAHISDPVLEADGGGHGGGGEATYSVARDAVNMVIASKTIEELTKPGGMKILKRELAEAINHALHAAHPVEEEMSEEEKKKQEHDEKKNPHHGIDHEWLDEIGMDAEEGPVLKVYFDKFMYSKA